MSVLYRKSEIKSGKTLFISAVHLNSDFDPYVLEHLVGSKSERAPIPGEIRDYRISRIHAQNLCDVYPAYKTRKAAMREAERISRGFHP